LLNNVVASYQANAAYAEVLDSTWARVKENYVYSNELKARTLMMLSDVHKLLARSDESGKAYKVEHMGISKCLAKDAKQYETVVESVSRDIDEQLVTSVEGGPSTVAYVTSVEYDNPLLNNEHLMRTAQEIGGAGLVSKLLDLGSDKGSTELILSATAIEGAAPVLCRLLSPSEPASARSAGTLAVHTAGIDMSIYYEPKARLSLPSVSKSSAIDPEEVLVANPTGSGDSKDSLAYCSHYEHSAHSDNLKTGRQMVSLTGGTIMKLVETKEAIKYIFTEIIPILSTGSNNTTHAEASKDSSNKQNSFLDQEGMWIGLHLLGGLSFTLAHPGSSLSISNKLILPVTSTSAYVARHYYHIELKQQLFGEGLLAGSCVVNMVSDTAFGVVMALPFAVTTANPLPLAYGAAQGAAMSSVNCLATNTEASDYSWISSIAANTAAVAAVAYTTVYRQGAVPIGMSRFESAILDLNKLASMLPIVTLLHKLVKAATDGALDYLYTSPTDDANQPEETVGTTGETNQNNHHEEL
jgi:hypothetical protein